MRRIQFNIRSTRISKFTEERRIFCLKRLKRYAKLLKEGYIYAVAARKVGYWFASSGKSLYRA